MPISPSPGGDPAALAVALDCDLGLSPVTNLMPILRHGLSAGVGQAELTAEWVSVPDLQVQPDGQRRHEPDPLRRSGRQFLGDDTVDDDGLVVDYPGIAHGSDLTATGCARAAPICGANANGSVPKNRPWPASNLVGREDLNLRPSGYEITD
jgi:hypothetical protein